MPYYILTVLTSIILIAVNIGLLYVPYFEEQQWKNFFDRTTTGTYYLTYYESENQLIYQKIYYAEVLDSNCKLHLDLCPYYQKMNLLKNSINSFFAISSLIAVFAFLIMYFEDNLSSRLKALICSILGLATLIIIIIITVYWATAYTLLKDKDIVNHSTEESGALFVIIVILSFGVIQAVLISIAVYSNLKENSENSNRVQSTQLGYV